MRTLKLSEIQLPTLQIQVRRREITMPDSSCWHFGADVSNSKTSPENLSVSLAHCRVCIIYACQSSGTSVVEKTHTGMDLLMELFATDT